MASQWGACDCSGANVPSFDSSPVVVQPGAMNCKAGYYVGTFKGDWRPGIGDIPPLGTLITVTITPSDAPDKPGLALTLEEQIEGAGSEFQSYTVRNGCLVGTASSGAGQDHPFVAAITGSLRCDTGAFEGHVDGYYDLFGLGSLSRWYFAGSMLATFDLADDSLEQGTWDLREKQSSAPDGPGGKATWSAMWKSDQSPALPPECLALIAGDAGMAEPDAGSPFPGDAGH